MVLTRCPDCGRAGIVARVIDRTYAIGGKQHTVRGVVAHVCPHCGATFLGSTALKAIDKALARKRGHRRERAA